MITSKIKKRMKVNVDLLLQIKLSFIELVKDSPVLIYVAFYEPLHDWLIKIAEGWNPVLQLILNIMAVIYGVARLLPVFSNWFGSKDEVQP
jgi:hypothetical protein